MYTVNVIRHGTRNVFRFSGLSDYQKPLSTFRKSSLHSVMTYEVIAVQSIVVTDNNEPTQQAVCLVTIRKLLLKTI